ncbi:MAG: tRNA pseudouridine(55) synthase TruB [Clostridia bacterium]|nr:tRNA pseudouridine(55) synthase TruB [Clostridia bacterium]
MDGFVVLDKAAGVTSFKAAACLRALYHEKKTGHTGTLDPMATGVLPVALGRATRFIDFLPSLEKAYVAAMRFGLTTDTLDITGKVLSETPCRVTAEELTAVLPAFTGGITQLPPMYSAVSVGGRRLYELARKGLDVERAPRAVTVYELTLTRPLGENEFEIYVSCSKGTYVRTLIDDIGRTLGPGAVMTALRRVKSNGFSIDDAHTEEALLADPAAALLPTEHPFLCFPEAIVTEKQAARFQNGGELSLDRLPAFSGEGLTRVKGPDGAFLGLGEADRETGVLRVRRVFPKEP